ncbi:hypothetical protein ACHAWU_009400 [Discostella pseudostelligera]|uniref:Plastid lipid-associated protein/fibrillin conserved domain-containing protein n=1 Tax=Discostella pseudostelligera TaxID=259834 RepID=A0ABD3LZT2_9STRA
MHFTNFLRLLILSFYITAATATSSLNSYTRASTQRRSQHSLPSPFLAFAASPPPPPPATWRTFLDSILPSLDNIIPSNKNNNIEDISSSQQRIELKRELVNACLSYYGRNSPSIRSQIESSIDKLTPYNPTLNSATSPLLQRKWVVLWTSEKEINFFLENGISSDIIQTLSDGEILENYIPFVKIGGGNGGFGVTGRISVDDETMTEDEEGKSSLIRTKFKFEKANLNLGRWGTYNFPPVGEGWFDTIYLDEDLRIDTNSRNDILICRAE